MTPKLVHFERSALPFGPRPDRAFWYVGWGLDEDGRAWIYGVLGSESYGTGTPRWYLHNRLALPPLGDAPRWAGEP